MPDPSTNPPDDGQTPPPQPEPNDYSQDVASVGVQQQAAVTDYTADVQAISKQKSQPVVQSIYAASRLDPERHAKVVNLADKVGLGVDLVDRNYEYMNGLEKYDDQRQAADMAVIFHDRPQLHQWLQNRDHAAISQDDLPVLAQIHDRIKAMYPDPIEEQDTRPEMSWANSLGNLLSTKFHSGEEMLTAMTLLPSMQNAYRQLTGVTDAPGPHTPLGELYTEHDAIRDAEQEAAQFKQSTAKKLAGVGVGTLIDPTNYLPFLGAAKAANAVRAIDGIITAATEERAAAAGVRGAAATMSAQTGYQTATEVANKEGSVTAGDIANIPAQMALSYVLGKSAGGLSPIQQAAGQKVTLQEALHSLLPLATIGAAGSVGSLALNTALTEQPIPTAGQVIDTALTGVVGTGVFGLLALPGATRDTAVRLLDDTMAVHTAQANAKAIASAAAFIKESATVKRSDGRAQLLLDAIADASGQPNSGKMFMQGEAWGDYWKAKGADPAQILSDLTGDKDAYVKALAEGGKIELPGNKFLLQYADTEHFAGLLGKLSLDPAAPSIEESNDIVKQLPKRVQELRDQIVNATDTTPEHAAIGQDFAAKYAILHPELPKEDVALVSDVWSRTVVGLAKSIGVDPKELYGKIELHGDMPGIVQRLTETADRVASMEAPPVEARLEQALQAPRNDSLEFSDLVRQWKKANGERAVPNGPGWSELVAKAEQIDQANGRSFEQATPAGHTTLFHRGVDLRPGMKMLPDERGLVWFSDKKENYGAGKPGVPTTVIHIPDEKIAVIDNEKGLTDIGKKIIGMTENGSKSEVFEAAEKLGYVAVKRGMDVSLRPMSVERYQQEARGGYTPLGDGRARIVLGKRSDASTPFHELMHFALDTMVDFAGHEGATDQLKADVATLLEFTGHKTIENKQAMDKEIDALFAAKHARGEDGKFTPEEQTRLDELRAPHERAAVALEQYFMEGKAPAKELVTAFERIRSLMVAIYRGIKDLITLTPPVREVFDRLIASEDELAAQKQVMEDRALFETKESAAMSPEEFAAYQKRRSDADLAAQRTTDRAYLKVFYDKQRQSYKDEQDKIRAEVATSHNADPDQRAISVLQSGKLPDGTELPENLRNLKLDKADLVKLYGEHRLGELPGPKTENNPGKHVYTTKDGLPLNEAAELLGFQNGDELWHALTKAPDFDRLVEQETAQRMTVENPDAINSREGAKAALRALHSTRKIDLLQEEARALAYLNSGAKSRKEAGKAAAAQVFPRQIVRAMAQDRISAMAAKDINPEKFRVAEAKAAREAFAHAATGKYDKALLAKQQQILNAELYRAALDGKKEAGDIRISIKGFRKGSKQETLGKAGGWEWTVTYADGASAKFDNPKDAETASRLKPGSTWARTSSYVDAVNQILGGIDTRNVPAAEAQRRAELLKFMADANAKGEPIDLDADAIALAQRTPWKTMSLRDLRSINDALDNIWHDAKTKFEFIQEGRKETLRQTLDTAITTVIKNSTGPKPNFDKPGFVEKYTGYMYRVADILRRADGHKTGGFLQRMWQFRLNDAMDNEVSRTVEAVIEQKRLQDEWGKLGPLGTSAWRQNRKEFIPEIGRGLTKLEQLMVALNWGNAGNRERLMSGEKWTPDQVKAVIKKLDAKDWEYVKGLWKHIDTFWPEIRALEERVHGVAPEKVQALPFDTDHGQMPGGYFPVRAAGWRSSVERHADEAEDLLAGRGGAYAMTAHGHAKERTGDAERPLDLSFDVVGQHIQRVIHDLTHRETLMDLNRIASGAAGKDFQQTMIQHYGGGALDAMKQQLLAIAGGPRADLTGLEKPLSFIRQGFNASIRAFNVTGGVMQLAGLPAAVPRLGVKYFLKALPQAFNPMAHHWADSQSTHLLNRNAERNQNLNEVIARTSSLAPIKPLQGMAYLFYSKMWKILDAHAWWAGYYKSMEESGGDHELSKRVADQVMIDTQGAMRIGDQSQMLRGGELAKVFTNNMSWANANFNLMASSIHEFLDKGGVKNPAQLVRMGASLMTYAVVAPAIYLAARQALTGQDMSDWKDPKKIGKRLSVEAAYTMLSSVPIARDISGAVEGFNGDVTRYQGPQGTGGLARLVTLTADAAKAANTGTVTHGEMKALINAIGVGTHMPSTEFNRLWDAYIYSQQHSGNPLMPYLFGPPLKK